MLYKYKAIDDKGGMQEGEIEASTQDSAIVLLQRRGLILKSVKSIRDDRTVLDRIFDSVFHRITNKDIVMLSQQISTLFQAQVSALRVFTLLAEETVNPSLQLVLKDVADDLQGGTTISASLAKHPRVFSSFYVNMVRSGEESGKLDETFMYLAESIDRTYEVTSKARNALIYPAFVVVTFVGVMSVMFTVVIPKISAVLKDTGGDVPIYTKIILNMSDFLIAYGFFFLAFIIVGCFFFIRYIKTEQGRLSMDQFKITVPYVGDLFRKLYLSRIADSMQTMLLSGVSMLKALEVTKDVVGNHVYEQIIEKTIEDVKGGSSVSNAFSNYKEIPGIMSQMIKVGEETGELGGVLKTLSKFYSREVMAAVDTLVGLIEPVMIVGLGLGVGVLLASVLIPIYNISSTFGG